MIWLVFAVLATVPLLAFWATYRLSRGRYALAVVIAGLAGSALGAFLASAGSAMSSAVSPTDALLRGGTIGFLAGISLGILAAGLAWARRARTPPAGPPSDEPPRKPDSGSA